VSTVADPGDEITIVEAIAALRADGFTSDFSVAPGGVVSCGTCGHNHDPSELMVEATVRVEGLSDPADEAAAFGLSCGSCGLRGVLVVAYGPAATADEAAVITALGDRR
jgi:hypothetical protein